MDRRHHSGLLPARWSFLVKHEHVLLMEPGCREELPGPQALCFTSIPTRYSVRFTHSDDFSRAMFQARVANSMEPLYSG